MSIRDRGVRDFVNFGSGSCQVGNKKITILKVLGCVLPFKGHVTCANAEVDSEEMHLPILALYFFGIPIAEQRR